MTVESANVDLLFALNEADEERATKAVDAGADVNLQSSWGTRALHVASLRGAAPLIEFLLTKGAQSDVTDNEGFTPLMVAALNGHTDAVKKLIVNGADPNATRLDSGETALHLAMNSNSHGVVTALLDNRADANAQTNDDNSTPLHVAAELNAQHAAKALLNNPACETTMKNSSGKTAAQVARDHEYYCMAEHLDMCSSLLSQHDEMLVSAVLAGDARRVAAAVDAGANVNLQSPGGARLLHAASVRGAAPIISLLLTNNAKVDVTDAEGFTPLMVAALTGHTDAVKELIANGADPNATRLDSGETALHLAMNSNSRGVVTALLDNRADVNAQTDDNSTPLHVAAELNAQHAADALLNNPACEITMKNSSGKTAAQVARDHEYYRLAEYLDMCSSPLSQHDEMLVSAVLARDAGRVAVAVAAGADVNLQSPGGARPLHAASVRGAAPIIMLLLTNNAQVDETDAEGFTPLMVAALNGHTDAVKELIAYHANPNATRLVSGETALHLAMNSNSHGVVTALLDAGADVNAQTNDDQSTPLHVAAELNAQHAAEALMKAPLFDDTMRDGQDHTAEEVARLHGHVNMVRVPGGADQMDSTVPQTLTQSQYDVAVRPRVVEGRLMPASDKVYKCTSRPRGHVLVINYHKFQGLSWRDGSPSDVTNLRYIFTEMGYKVTTHSDLSQQETLQVLDNFRSDGNLEKVDSAFICVLSHGEDKETFFTSDDDMMTVNQVRNMFKDEECPQLKGKPKVFLFNFCRGPSIEKGCIKDVAQDAIPIDPRSPSPTDQRPPPIETFKDMFTINATVEGVKALRHEERGTFFVIALCQVLAAYAHNSSMVELVNELNKFMIRRMSGTTPEIVIHASKKFYINPVHPEHQ